MTDQWHEGDDYQPRFQWKLWARMLSFTRPYRRYVLLMMGVAMVTAACDVVIPLLAGQVIDHVTQEGATVEAAAGLWRYAMIFGVVVVLFTASILTFIILAGSIATSVAHDIRRDGFQRLQELSFSYYDTKAVGWLMARMTSDCLTVARTMGWAIIDFVWGTCVITFLTTVMFYLNWKLALLVLSIVPVLLVVSRYFQVRVLIAARLARSANSRITASFSEGMMGVRTSKSFVRERANLAEFQQLTGEMFQHSVRGALYAAIFLPLVLTVCSAGVGLALWYGGQEVIGGTISIGTLVIFLAYAGQLANPVQEMAQTFTALQGAQASAERILQLLDTPPQIVDTPEALERMRAQAEGENQRADLALDGLPDRIETITFDHVGFAYVEGRPVLRDFDFEVTAGQTVALVGPTGGGKSTIVNLVCRFYEPSTGKLRINGLDYRHRSLHWLQSQLGMVLQTPHLFSGSVRENIRYGRLEADDAEVEEAARVVNAHDFITRLEDGYETEVGEGGGKLSTGQKQLISLARAILADPQILIMDEATSSVDTQTERLIQEGVDRVLSGRISFVIAHRLSTIRNADCILVIEDGRATERGTHDQLMRRRGYYHQLYTQQFAQEIGGRLLAGPSSLGSPSTAT
ncbi:MAG: ABC transporter ATP-binding protein/permease [Phycisphaerae bacterium]|nr:ABC transporter ATP-binding protein/permease [Phycisphaerae bacterium]